MTGIVMVGVDGSDGSRQALRWGVELARATGRTVRAVRVWRYPATAGVNLIQEPLAPADDVDREVEEALRRLVREELGASSADVSVGVVRGDAAGGLLAEAKRTNATLLVVGSRGLGGFGGLLLGSVGRSVAEYAPCPVAIVPRYVPVQPDGHAPIVLGVDGSEGAERAAAWAGELGAALGAVVLAVHAIHLIPSTIRAQLYEELRPETERMLDRAWCTPIRAAGADCRTEVAEGDARDVLLSVAAREAARLVVVGSRGLGLLSGVLLGSVGSYLAQRLDRPLVIVPSRRRTG